MALAPARCCPVSSACAGDKAAMPAGGAIGARQLQGPAAAEVAAVADGVFGWQHALQGRQKVPA